MPVCSAESEPPRSLRLGYGWMRRGHGTAVGTLDSSTKCTVKKTTCSRESASFRVIEYRTVKISRYPVDLPLMPSRSRKLK